MVDNDCVPIDNSRTMFKIPNGKSIYGLNRCDLMRGKLTFAGVIYCVLAGVGLLDMCRRDLAVVKSTSV